MNNQYDPVPLDPPDYLSDELGQPKALTSLQDKEEDEAVKLLDDTPKAEAVRSKTESMDQQVMGILEQKDLTPAERIELIEGAAAESKDQEVVRKLAFMKQQLQEETLQSRQEFLVDIEKGRRRRAENARAIAEVREDILKGRDGVWTLSNMAKMANAINPIAGAYQAATGQGPDASVVEDFLVGDFYPRVGLILQRYAAKPGLAGTLAAMATPQEQANLLRDTLLDIDDPDTRRNLLTELRADIEDAGWVTDGDAQVQQMVDLLFGGIEYEQGVSSSENIYASIEMLGLGLSFTGAVAKGIKAARKGIRFLRGVDAAELSDDLASELGLLMDTPAFRPGSAADYATETTKGAKRAVEGIADPSKLDGTGMRVEQVMHELVMPNAKSKTMDMDSRVFVEDAFLSSAQKDVLVGQQEAKLTDALQSRPNSSQVWVEGGNINSRVVLGNTSGTGYKNRKQVTDLIKNTPALQGMKAEPIQSPDGKWFVVAQDSTPINSTMLSDVEMEQVLRSPGRNNALMGKAQRFSDDFVRSTNVFTARSMQVQSAFNKLLKPFRSMPVSRRANVLRVLQKYEGKRDPTDADLLAELSPKDAKGARAVLNAAEKSWGIENFRVRGELEFNNFRHYTGTVAGEAGQYVRPLDEGERLPSSAKVMDPDGMGKVIDADQVPENAKLYQLAEPDSRGATHYMSVAEDGLELNELPDQVIARIPGYIGPRLYQSPFFITQKMADGRFGAIKTAPTREAAQKHVEALRAANPEDEFSFREAREIDAGDGSVVRMVDASTAQQYAANGILNTSHRGARLEDVEYGLDNLMGIEERINAMTNSASLSAGVKKWNSYMETMWNNTYGDLFQGKFSFGQTPLRKDSVTPSDPRVVEALAVRDYMLSVNNMTDGQVMNAIQPARNAAADFVSGMFRSIARTGLTKVDGQIRATGDTIANNVSGLSQGAINTAKTLTAGAFLFLNAPRMAIMQTSMMFSYMGVDGAFKYMMSGKGLRDMMVLTFDGLQKSDSHFNKGRRAMALAAGKALGMSKKEVHELLDSFESSSLRGVADNHIYTLSTIADTRKGLATTNAMDNLGRAVELSKSAGFDVGVMAETRMAFLVSRNKWQKINGRSPSTRQELDEVTDMALNLTMNQNRSDRVIGQDGAVGIFTQFLSHQIKMSARLLGSASNLGEAGMLSPKELRRMAALQVAGWGMGGLGLTSLVYEVFPDLPEQYQHALAQGIMGTIGNFLLNAANSGDPVRFAFSEEFGPANFIGSYSSLMSDVLGEIAEGDVVPAVSTFFSGILPLDAPFSSLMQNTIDAVKFTRTLMGDYPGEFTEKSYLSGLELMRTLPLVNNLVKAYAIANRGVAVDSLGQAVVEQSKDTWPAAVFGIEASDVTATRRLTEQMFGEYSEADEDALYNAMEEQAREDAAQIGRKLYDAAAFDDKAEALVELENFMEANSERVLAITGGKRNEAYWTYMAAFRNALEPEREEEATKARRILERIYDQTEQGQINLQDKDPISIIKQSGLSPELTQEYVTKLEGLYQRNEDLIDIGEDLTKFLTGEASNGY